MFDLRLTDDSVEPINLRLFLAADGQPLTETWLYQYSPPPPDERDLGACRTASAKAVSRNTGREGALAQCGSALADCTKYRRCVGGLVKNLDVTQETALAHMLLPLLQR